MGQKGLMHKSDVRVAIACLVIGLLLCAFSFAQIRKIENSKKGSLATLELGKTAFQLNADDQCVGALQSELEHQKIFELRSSGELRANYDGADHLAKFKVDASFNPLGQLNYSKLSLGSDEFNLLVTTQDVNPIAIQLQLSSAGHSYSRSITLPGPLTLQRRNDSKKESYDLVHELLILNNFPQGQEITNSVTNTLKLKIEALISGPSACSEPKALSLGPLVESMKLLTQSINTSQLGKHP